ncbi:MAG TPA: ATP-binding protein [Xanthobacteraceae bacterium]|nr:ATP-binding protein [Xanthobacteraceae bacterium]
MPDAAPALENGKVSNVTGALLGYIQSVHGSQGSISLLPPGSGVSRASATVGKFVKIHTGKALLIGLITDVTAETSAKDRGHCGIAHADLTGEISDRDGALRFRRGIADYPTIGDPVTALTSNELRVVFDPPGARTVRIGQLQQDNSISVGLDVDELLTKHFAVLGTTGVGKSSAVALILQQIMQARPELRVLLLDVHNEYSHCFGEQSNIVHPRNLKLPFWLFNFEEIVDILFGGRPGLDEEVGILAEVIPIAKTSYTQYRAGAERAALKRFDSKNVGYTVDTPVPYRLADLLSQIDERMGKLENRSSRLVYHKLLSRIETVSNDPRYSFMFDNANVGGDTMAESLSQLFRVPALGKPITVLQLAGFPAEVIDAVVSVLCRMAFDFGLWSDGASPMLLMCEEAHRYAAADRNVGFGPTRRAISRLAKEGRKYGVFLGLVTQRPAELDPTIISQCSTLFAMRMSNDRDQALLRSAVSDHAANLFAFVPTLGTREAVAFGVGVPLPTRLTFADVPAHLLPRSESFAKDSNLKAAGEDANFISAVVERWRGATMKASPEDAVREARLAAAPELAPAQPGPAPAAANATIDPSRFSLLKKPITERPDSLALLRTSAAAGQQQRWPAK